VCHLELVRLGAADAEAGLLRAELRAARAHTAAAMNVARLCRGLQRPTSFTAYTHVAMLAPSRGWAV
jgi:hypothetical protein